MSNTNTNDPGEAAVPAGFRLGAGWEVSRYSGRTSCDKMGCGVRASVFLVQPPSASIHARCPAHAVQMGALVPIDPPVAPRALETLAGAMPDLPSSGLATTGLVPAPVAEPAQPVCECGWCAACAIRYNQANFPAARPSAAQACCVPWFQDQADAIAARAEVEQLRAKLVEAQRRANANGDLAMANLREADARIYRTGWADGAEATREHLCLSDTPWPLLEVLERLAGAVEHGLQTHSCDHHGHEGDKYAAESARAIIERFRVLPIPVCPEGPPAGAGEAVGPCVHCKEIRPLAEVDHWERCPAHPARVMVDSLRAQLSEMGKTVDRLNEEANHWHQAARNKPTDAGTGADTSGGVVPDWWTSPDWRTTKHLFVANEDDDLCRLCRGATDDRTVHPAPQADAIKAAVASERERCLALVEAALPPGTAVDAFDVADLLDAIETGADAPGAGKP